MISINPVDVLLAFFYILTTYLLVKRGWFYSFYRFFKFLVVILISFLVARYGINLKPESWPFSNLHFYLAIQILSFAVLMKIVRFQKIFIYLNRKTVNLDQFIFFHHLNSYLNYIPSVIVTFFITFCLYTILYSFNAASPYYRQMLDNSYSNSLASQIYFASNGVNESKLFENLIFKITASARSDTQPTLDDLDQNVILKQEELINAEREKKGLADIGMQVYYPEQIQMATPVPAFDSPRISINPAPTVEMTPTPAPTPELTEEPVFILPETPRPAVIDTSEPTPLPRRTDTPAPSKTAKPTPTPKPVPPPVNVEEEERKVLVLINQIRSEHQLQILEWEESMAVVARAHSIDMNSRGFFDHVTPDGVDPWQRLKIGGVSYKSAAENLAGAGSPESLVNSWMKSEGHRKNILTPGFTKTGIGISENNQYGLLATQVFRN